MSLTTPTTSEISENIIAQIQISLNQTIPLLPKSFTRVLAKALSGVIVLLYKYGGFIFLQMFVTTASTKPTEINGKIVTPIIEWGRLVGAGDPIEATRAELLIDITVETIGGTLPSGTQLIKSETGVTYVTLGSVLLSTSTVQATVRAVADQAGGGGAGTIGNLTAGDTLSFANPLGNVSPVATVSAQTVTGAEGEGLDTAYRQRVIDRFQKKPQGGAYSDYEIWGEEAAGIINVYPYTGNNPGQVDVYVEATVASSGSADGIPTTAQLQAVLDLINYDSGGLATRRPAGALVNTLAITRQGFDVIVEDLVVDNLADVQSQITSALTGFFLAAEPYIVGLSVPPRHDRITRSAIIGLVEDIVTANNGTFTTARFVYTGLGGSLETYILAQGEKAKLVNMSFI